MKQIGFFDEGERLERLRSMGDPLVKLAAYVDFEMFREGLNEVFAKEDRGLGGRPPFDYVLMFKILLLQQLYNIADDNTEYQINDRLSFQRFLGLGLGDKVPDAKSIWRFRDVLSKSGKARGMFDLFNAMLKGQGVITRRGTIVDATFAQSPRQRNSREENEEIKQGGKPEWKESKRRQKDTDARWTKKGGQTHFGYKDHVAVDSDSKIITNFSVTDAAVHDSQQMENLITKEDEVVYGDSAYMGKKIQRAAKKKNPKIKLKIQSRATRNHPLTDRQKAMNRTKAKTRCRVEHVFATMKSGMGGLTIRSIGIERAECAITLKNLAYNMRRYVFLSQPPPLGAV